MWKRYNSETYSINTATGKNLEWIFGKADTIYTDLIHYYLTYLKFKFHPSDIIDRLRVGEFMKMRV